MKGSRACKKEKPKSPIKSKKEKQEADKATTRQGRWRIAHKGTAQTVRRPTE